MHVLLNGVTRFFLFALVWWALSEGDPRALWFGLPMVALATLASLWLQPPRRLRIHPVALIRFLAYFAHHSLRGGVDVARRALDPRLPLAPGILEYRLRLPRGPVRVFLADTLSLLPGTLSVELAGDSLTLHVLDEGLPVNRYIGELEERIAQLFGHPLLHPAAEKPQ